jgi:hypothetical protein
MLNRLGELVWPDNTSLQLYHHVPLRHSVQWLHHAFSYLLPVHKADRFFEGNHIVIQEAAPPNDAYRPFLRYLTSRDALFPGPYSGFVPAAPFPLDIGLCNAFIVIFLLTLLANLFTPVGQQHSL